jgi:hypothetical protein
MRWSHGGILLPGGKRWTSGKKAYGCGLPGKKVECGGQIDVDRKTSGCTIEDLDWWWCTERCLTWWMMSICQGASDFLTIAIHTQKRVDPPSLHALKLIQTEWQMFQLLQFSLLPRNVQCGVSMKTKRVWIPGMSARQSGTSWSSLSRAFKDSKKEMPWRNETGISSNKFPLKSNSMSLVKETK